MTNKKRLNITSKLSFMLVLMMIMLSFSSVFADAPTSESVFIIPVRGEITPAMAVFIQDNINEANRVNAKGIIIEISTLGGRADAAMDIKSAILDSNVPVTVFITDRAVSAGALITVAANTILMTPGSQMGAAEPIPNDPKIVSAISAEFRAAAEARGRDPHIAAAMADRSIVIENLTAANSILSLTAQEALRVGFADSIVSDREAALRYLGLENAPLIEISASPLMWIAQFLTRSEVASILLIIGFLGFLVEFFVPGFGVPGIIGLSAFALFFGGGILAGSTQWLPVVLFIVGLVLLIIEIAIPGFGIFGIGGIMVMLTSFVLAANDPVTGIISVVIALIVSLIAIPILYKIFGKSKLFKGIVVSDVLKGGMDEASIYAKVKIPEVGQIGVAITALRPAGIVDFDGVRYDCMSDGQFINAQDEVKVVQATAAKVVVVLNRK